MCIRDRDISLENLYLTPDGKIGGLPEKAANLINKTKDNAKIERIKDALINIIGHNRTSGDPVSYTHLKEGSTAESKC